MVKAAIIAGTSIYIIGFALVFWMHTQMPATLGLALLRSAAWPVSIIRREFWPRGTPLPMD